MGGRDGAVLHDRIDLVHMAFGESILDDAAERPGRLAIDHVSLVHTLFGAGQGGIMKVLLEHDGRVIVDLGGFDVEHTLAVARLMPGTLMTVVESEEAWVLLHARVAPIKGEVGKILAGHVG